ncbi:hypothetical protein P691DRAFT_777613 [Macrolepiota fuliginosa MF-IS2]|uniref:Cation/H+ exchanger transmembrane domain-containing protein n=1 Tax=Macrolepiota fuliginosa MF-IS2 TaxID=1400762 RepID=A0A9P5X6C1_9AGAR|nr:hypothetical protein P691DRAFT_777613 [Macrolepiota fuliginosa MF-IS2]
MPEFSQTVFSIIGRRASAEAGGLLDGTDPTIFNPNDPLRLWIVQIGIIVGTSTLLSLVLGRIRQPRVIAEIIGGIILGPSAFGRIPGFTKHIFPAESKPYLSLTANIGLCLFLFLVGLEIDTGVIKSNARTSATVALAGMAVPFGLGAALSIPLYHEFIDPSINYKHFMLFTCVAYSITAFPVLCRILAELKLFDTTVGIVVLSAGVGNDIVGWILLALSVALSSSGAGITALWILLVCFGWTLVVVFPIRYILGWLARKTGSVEKGPTVFFMTVTIITMFGSAFFTDIIGVHAIFGEFPHFSASITTVSVLNGLYPLGAFMVGAIVPREGGLAIALMEKLEETVSVIFLPLYFTISGLSTDLGLLDNGISWAYTFAIMGLAFTGKFCGCSLAAHYMAGVNWRESSVIGVLMSCKGLVELIVLNIALSVGVLTPRVFSMFVVEALVLTFMTTPLVLWLYPVELRRRVTKGGTELMKATGHEDGVLDAKAKRRHGKQKSLSGDGDDGSERTRFTVVLDRIEHLPGAMAVAQLINPLVYGFEDEPEEECPGVEDQLDDEERIEGMELPAPVNEPIPAGLSSPTPSSTSRESSSSSSLQSTLLPTTVINALRLIRLTDRSSTIMKSDTTALLHSDPLLGIFRMFALLQGFDVCGEVDVVYDGEMATRVLQGGEKFGAEMIVVPWVVHSNGSGNLRMNGTGTPGTPIQPSSSRGSIINNPLDALFKSHTRAHSAPVRPRTNVLDSPETQYSQPPTPNPGHHVRRGQNLWTLPAKTSVVYSQFIRNVFAKSYVDVGLYIDQSGRTSTSSFDDDAIPEFEIPQAVEAGPMNALGFMDARRGRGRVHIFLPFFGGPDDRLALEFVVGLCRKNERLKATVVRFKKVEENVIPGGPVSGSTIPEVPEDQDQAQDDRNESVNRATVASNVVTFPDTVYGHATTEVRLQSDTADNVIWARYVSPPTPRSEASPSGSPLSRTQDRIPLAQSCVPRVTFKEVTSSKPLHDALDEACALQQQCKRKRASGRSSRSQTAGVGVVIVTGRSRHLAAESHLTELKEIKHEDSTAVDKVFDGGMMREMRKTVGDVGSVFVGRGVGVGVWVVQAALNGER